MAAVKERWSLDDGCTASVRFSVNQTIGSLTEKGVEILDDFDITVVLPSGPCLKLSRRGLAVDIDARMGSVKLENSD